MFNCYERIKQLDISQSPKGGISIETQFQWNCQAPFWSFSIAVLILSDMVFSARSVAGVLENFVWNCCNLIFANLLYFIAWRLWICERTRMDWILQGGNSLFNRRFTLHKTIGIWNQNYHVLYRPIHRYIFTVSTSLKWAFSLSGSILRAVEESLKAAYWSPFHSLFRNAWALLFNKTTLCGYWAEMASLS